MKNEEFNKLKREIETKFRERLSVTENIINQLGNDYQNNFDNHHLKNIVDCNIFCFNSMLILLTQMEKDNEYLSECYYNLAMEKVNSKEN